MKRAVKLLSRRVFACLVIMAMVLSGTKMPVAYAYFTAAAQQEQPFVFMINGKCCANAAVHFLDEHLIDEGAAGTMGMRTKSVPNTEVLQPVVTKPTVFVVITLEEGFGAQDVDISTVEIRYEDRSAPALAGVVRGGDLVVEFDRSELVSWFNDLDETSSLITFEVAGEGTSDEFHEFTFTGQTEIKLVGAYETTAVKIDGPDGYLIPEGGKTATGTYHLVNQSGTVLEAVWTVSQSGDGVAVNPKTGQVTLDAAAVPGFFTIKAEFERPDGTHRTEKIVELVADPHLAITGPHTITIGAESQQYTIKTRGNPVLEHINWLISGSPDGVTVNRDGMVTVSEQARAGEFTLALTAELKGLPLSADTTVVLEEPAPVMVEAPPVEEPEDTPEVSLPENAIVIKGEDLILIPSGDRTAKASYAATDRDGSPLTGVFWSIGELPEGVTFDDAEGLLVVTKEAPEGTVVLEATREVLDDTGAPEGTIVFCGKKNITLALPAPVAVRISGPESILLPGADPEDPSELDETIYYTAEVLDQKGNLLSGQDMKWSLEHDIPGVGVSANGVLTVTPAASAGVVTLIVTVGEIIGTLRVALLDTPPDEDIEEPLDPEGEVVVPGGPNEPPNREEEPEGPQGPGMEGPDGDGDPGTEPEEQGTEPDHDPGTEPDPRVGEPGDENDADPGVEPGAKPGDSPKPGNEATVPEDSADGKPGESGEPGESGGSTGGQGEGSPGGDSGGDSSGDSGGQGSTGDPGGGSGVGSGGSGSEGSSGSDSSSSDSSGGGAE